MKRLLAAASAVALILAAASSPALAGQPPAPTHKDVEFAKPGDKPILLDLFLPKKGEKPSPVIVYVHGGGWAEEQVHEVNPRNSMAPRLTDHGYAVAAINYRLVQDAIFPAQINDCKAAVRWVRAHAKEYNFDPARVGAWGDSAGGTLVALLGTTGGVKELEGDEGNLDQSSRVQAVCDWFGPADFPAIVDAVKAAGPNGNVPGRGILGMVSKLIGTTALENRDKAAKASPETYITKDVPPFLIMHGDKDTTVPFAESQALYDALKKAGADVTFKTIVGSGHGFGSPEAFNLVEDFFDKTLKGAAADAPVRAEKAPTAPATGAAPAAAPASAASGSAQK